MLFINCRDLFGEGMHRKKCVHSYLFLGIVLYKSYSRNPIRMRSDVRSDAWNFEIELIVILRNGCVDS